MTIEKVLHYTSMNNWEQIQKAGELSTKTRLFTSYYNRSTPSNINLKGTATIPENTIHKWEEYGLMEYVIKHTTAEILLEIDITNIKNCMVRDHTLCSPKGWADKYGQEGQDYFFECYNDFKNTKWKVASKLITDLNKYFNSSKALEKYHGQFIVPELWILEQVPLTKINRIN
jgi:hypothetical protein